MAGRLEWVAGLIELRRRHLLDAFRHFDRAAHYFEQSKEEKNLGSIHILKADGQGCPAWPKRSVSSFACLAGP
ncbi:MAG: hypothetical protein V3T83_07200, partial [Acidobacteriota bacterium]